MSSKVTRLSPTEDIVNKVAELKYEDLPDDVVQAVKKALLDTIACIVAGSSYTSVPEMVELIKRWGGTGEATILIYGGKVIAANAAFANGVMSKAVDLDDFHKASSHVSEYIVPVLLAMAELQKGASGKEFITAYVAGAEPVHKIGAITGGIAQGSARGIYMGLAGKFGAAVSAAKLHRLNREQIANTLGLAYVMSSCWSLAKTAPVGTGASYFEPGYQCQLALEHALMAEIGVTGPKEILSGNLGVFQRFLNWCEVDPDLVMADWGKPWLLPDTVAKLYPACGHTQAAIQGMLDIMAENKINVQDIASIHLTVYRAAFQPVCGPERWDPKDERDAKYSIAYTVATAATKKKVFVDDFTPEELARRDIRELMSRITADVDQNMPAGVSTVTVRLKDGREITKEGICKERASWDDLTQKLHNCAALSAKPISKGNLTQVIEKVMYLEEMDDITTLVPLLTP